MSFKYEEAVPWGRSFDEYRRMFNLTDADLRRKILGCADGPASFNAGMFQHGHNMISCDPLYQFTAAEIEKRIEATHENVISQARRHQEKFVWNEIKSVEELGRIRMEAMKLFLQDFEQGKKDGRYLTAELPKLPFVNGEFDLALCSHFLFFYSDIFTAAFHRQAIEELCRVAREVRIFPLLTYNGDLSPYAPEIVHWLKGSGHVASIETVPYEFQLDGNEMLRLISAVSKA